MLFLSFPIEKLLRKYLNIKLSVIYTKVQGKFNVIFLFIFIFPESVISQNTTKNWLFFNQLRFEFKNGTALYNPNNPSIAEDRTAVFSHPTTGELMLYFDGQNLRSGEELKLVEENIKNGSVLRQTSLILPLSKALNAFYLFTCQTSFNQDANLVSTNLTYSFIANTNGNYSVDSLNIPLNSNITPNVTAYPLNDDEGFWLVLHSFSGNNFIIYKVNESGIHFHQQQSIGFSIPNDLIINRTGTLNFSPNGQYLVFTHWSSIEIYRPQLDLFSFNIDQGILDAYYPLDNFLFQYGASFSPDNSKLYVSILDSLSNNVEYFLQYDISAVIKNEANNFEPINVSTIEGFNIHFANRHFQLGLDGRLYFSGNNTNRLYRIDNPNESVENLSFSYVSYPGDGFNFKAFPNFLQHEFDGLTISDNPILNCTAASIYILYPNPAQQILNIQISETCFQPFKLSLINLKGQVIFQDVEIMQAESTISLQNYASGSYFIVFNIGGRKITKKILII